MARGYTDPNEAERFLNPSLDDLGDPELLPDYEDAKNAILGARERRELIFVHGDYDVDGLSSATLLGNFLSKIGCLVKVHVPHRLREGYGIHRDTVADAAEAGAKLFLTCDCGITAFEQVALARGAGMRVVVTDHHSVGEDIPEAEAVVNPHRVDSQYPFPELSGCGVAFRLCEGLTKAVGWPVDKFRANFLDLATLGTIADVVPMVGENRILAKFGLKALSQTKRIGIRALLDRSGLSEKIEKKELSSDHVAWQVAPRLNAAGRIDEASLALNLLMSKDVEEARLLADRLEQLNQDRRDEQDRILEQAIDQTLREAWDQKYVLLLAQAEWHAGLVGIVAGRLVEVFGRPSFVGTFDSETGVARFSGRSIYGFNLAEALRANSDVISGGGHAKAAGFSVPIDKIDEARRRLESYARTVLQPEDLKPTVWIDLEVEGAEADLAAAESLAALQPTGEANRFPKFLSRKVRFVSANPTKNPEVAQVRVQAKDGATVPGVSFGRAEEILAIGSDQELDILFRPEVDNWNGRCQVKWRIDDFQPSSD